MVESYSKNANHNMRRPVVKEEIVELMRQRQDVYKRQPMAQPQSWHRVEAATDDVEWYLEFYCKPEDYFPKKYQTNPVHSEVLEAMQTVKPGRALDLGCGQGRNSLFLAQNEMCIRDRCQRRG